MHISETTVGRKRKEYSVWKIGRAVITADIICPNCHQHSTVTCPGPTTTATTSSAAVATNNNQDFVLTNAICDWCDNQATLKSKFMLHIYDNPLR